MNKEWCDNRKDIYKKELKCLYAAIYDSISKTTYLKDDEKETYLQMLDDAAKSPFTCMLDLKLQMKKFGFLDDGYNKSEYLKMSTEYDKWYQLLDVDRYIAMLRYPDLYNGDRLMDSEKIEFDGDIIITDPCYIINKDNDDDWLKCGFGMNMENINIHNYMTRNTLYGDWSCTTYNTNTGQAIGQFCADAGLVSVFLLDEVLNYNPDFDYHKNKKWTTTWIPNFKGTVQFVVEEDCYDSDGESCNTFEVKVVGHGIDKVTGERIDFIGEQTGL